MDIIEDYFVAGAGLGEEGSGNKNERQSLLLKNFTIL
jgi:hypothetical protein